uniref:Uncharacterized protein n=1 Tax=Calcidiscus leptoporus TaxID=127549 RepID=A0A7S0J0Q4_9EUKA
MSTAPRAVTATFGRGTRLPSRIAAAAPSPSGHGSPAQQLSHTSRTYSTPASAGEYDTQRLATDSVKERSGSQGGSGDEDGTACCEESAGTPRAACRHAIGNHLLSGHGVRMTNMSCYEDEEEDTAVETPRGDTFGQGTQGQGMPDTAAQLEGATAADGAATDPAEMAIIAEQQRLWDSAKHSSTSSGRTSGLRAPAGDVVDVDPLAVGATAAVGVLGFDACVVAEQQRIWNAIKTGEAAEGAASGEAAVAGGADGERSTRAANEVVSTAAAASAATAHDVDEAEASEAADAMPSCGESDDTDDATVDGSTADGSESERIRVASAEQLERTVSSIGVRHRAAVSSGQDREASDGASPSLRGFLKKRCVPPREDLGETSARDRREVGEM